MLALCTYINVCVCIVHKENVYSNHCVMYTETVLRSQINALLPRMLHMYISASIHPLLCVAPALPVPSPSCESNFSADTFLIISTETVKTSGRHQLELCTQLYCTYIREVHYSD